MNLSRPLPPVFALMFAGLSLTGLPGCASMGRPGAAGASTAASAPHPGAAAAGAAPAGGPGQPPAFAAVVKDAKETAGLINVWQKDEKVWLELKPGDFDKPFFLSPKIASGIGEGMVFGGLMADGPSGTGGQQVVEFHRVHNLVQMIAKNTAFVGRGGPASRSVAAGFSDSLLASTVVSSQPHPERKSVLVDANPLFLADLEGMGMTLQRSYHQGYTLDARNSAITTVRGKPDALVIETRNHYATAAIAAPTPGVPIPPGAPVPGTPDSVPDPRSLFVSFFYSLSKLPEQPMAPRVADPRVGYFTTTFTDFSDDKARTPKVRYVNRWRLEKRDPTAAMSEPVKPITFWLDRDIPEKYRPAITAGVLEWNKAFEKIGFRNAIVVKQQPDNADFDTLDVDVASIRWMTNSKPVFGAIGPSQVDPRTGEILDADIGIESLSSRAIRNYRAQILAAPIRLNGITIAAGDGDDAAAAALSAGSGAASRGRACDYADEMAEQLAYGLDVLEARGELAPDDPEADQFVEEYLKDVTMHEVGHTLGLRHNFRASRVYSDKQLSDPEFTRTHALTGSVMEYAPINLPRPGDPQTTPFQTTLGPYDYWAIEYAYKPVPAAQESQELQRIAGRSGEPQLAFGTDEDNSFGVDPESLQFDLGDDEIAFAKKRFDIARDLIARQEKRKLDPNQDYAVLRRSVGFAVRDMARTSTILARQIGGLRTLRDYPGSGRDPLEPGSPATQRDALDVLSRGLLSADSIRLSPELQRRLAPDFLERQEAAAEAGHPVATDFSVATVVLDIQRQLLTYLMSDPVAARILDSEGKADKPSDAFRLSELYARLTRDVWSELSTRGDIPAPRRDLQREYVNRLASALLRPSALSRADARSLMRLEARGLLPKIEAASRRGDLSTEARAHLLDAADTLRQALSAPMLRAGA